MFMVAGLRVDGLSLGWIAFCTLMQVKQMKATRSKATTCHAIRKAIKKVGSMEKKAASISRCE
jgi:hypothetical protein